MSPVPHLCTCWELTFIYADHKITVLPAGKTEGNDGDCEPMSWFRETSLECVLKELLSTSSRLGRLTLLMGAEAALFERPLVGAASSGAGVVAVVRERGGKRVLAGRRSSATSSGACDVDCTFSCRPRNLVHVTIKYI